MLRLDGYKMPSKKLPCILEVLSFSKLQREIWTLNDTDKVIVAVQFVKKLFPKLFKSDFNNLKIHPCQQIEDNLELLEKILNLLSAILYMTTSLIVYHPGPQVLVSFMLISNCAFLIADKFPGLICRSYAVAAVVAQALASSSKLAFKFGSFNLASIYIEKCKSHSVEYFLKNSITSDDNNVILQKSAEELEYFRSFMYLGMVYISRCDIVNANEAYEEFVSFCLRAGLERDAKTHSAVVMYMNLVNPMFGDTMKLLELAQIDCKACCDRDKDSLFALESHMYLANLLAYNDRFDESLSEYQLATKYNFYENIVRFFCIVTIYMLIFDLDGTNTQNDDL